MNDSFAFFRVAFVCRQEIADAGAVLSYDLLTMEDRQRFGWQVMLSDILSWLS